MVLPRKATTSIILATLNKDSTSVCRHSSSGSYIKKLIMQLIRQLEKNLIGKGSINNYDEVFESTLTFRAHFDDPVRPTSDAGY